MSKENPSSRLQSRSVQEKEKQSGNEHRAPNLVVLQELITRCSALPQLSGQTYADSSRGSRRSANQDVVRASELFSHFLSEFGFQTQDRFFTSIVLGAEYAASVGKDRTLYPPVAYVLRAMRQMHALESTRPGAVHYLCETQGIRNFARFSLEFWERQYDERNDTNPYMVIVVPSELSEPFITETLVYEELQDKLAALKTPHDMRIVEVDGLLEFFRAFVRLNKTYNAHQQNPIQLVLYDGHGLSHRIYLGETNFGVQQLMNNRFDALFKKRFSSVFSKRATFILASCYAAGIKKTEVDSVGVALKRKLSELLGEKIRVIATPDEATPFLNLTPTLKKNGALRLSIDSYPSDANKEGEPRYTKL